MVNIERPLAGREVLVVTGPEIRHDTYREDLRRELFAASVARSPVRKGTHSFWITYFTPTTAGGEYDGGDLAIRPVKFRGVIRMGRLPANTEEETVARQMRTMLEEVGHHWLVPADLQFRVNGGRRGLASRAEWTRHVNSRTRLEGLPLLGRGDQHWHSFLQTGKSPMDGQWWTEPRPEGAFTVWTNRALAGPALRPSGLPEVQLTSVFSDLDLALIGSLDPARAYPDAGNAFEWIEPQLVAPLPYHAGVCLCFSRTDMVLFGYDQDHRALGVSRTAAGLGGTRVASVRPARVPGPPFGLALRVVRRGDTYHFQARADESVAAHLVPEPRDVPGGVATAARVRGLFDGVDAPGAPTASPNLAGWSTIATVRSTSAPQAIGLVVDKWDGSALAEAAFFNLEVRRGTQETVHAFAEVPPALAAGAGLGSLGAEPRLDRPAEGALARVAGRRVLLLTAPYATVAADGSLQARDHFGHSAGDDRAPKVLLRAPSGDFAFGTSVTVNRSLAAPWAAGYLRDREVWGSARSQRVGDMVVPRELQERQLRAGRVTTFRTAFIIAASRAADVSDDMVERLDVIRRYWDEALPASSRGLMRSRSEL